MDKSEIARVQQYLRNKFGTDRFRVKARPDGSAEVHLGDEFIGTLYRDDEDGEVSYIFSMAILDFDLPAVAEV